MQGFKKIPGIFSVTSHSSMSWLDSARQFSLGTLVLTARMTLGQLNILSLPWWKLMGVTQRLKGWNS